MTTFTSREANQNFSRANRAAATGPVIITDRGKPTRVLLSYEDYRRLLSGPSNILDALADPDSGHVEFDIPRRSKDLPRAFDVS